MKTDKPQIEGLAGAGLVKLPPNSDGMTDVVSRIGYSLSEAIADIVDNSIDAGAKRVVIQLHRNRQQIYRITIADDGCGMSSEHLGRIMQFGVQTDRRTNCLGKYGIGLKTASFSQCRSFTVVTKRAREFSARRWSLELAKRDWTLELIKEGDARAFWKRDWSPIPGDADSGTIVVWDGLQRLVPQGVSLDTAVTKLRLRLGVDLGLRFHRFIERGQTKIFLKEQSESGTSLPDELTALDPFDYGGKSGKRGYPITFRLRMGADVPLSVEAHIWPPKSNSPNYKLGAGAVVKRQGFYFYRNDRLIEAGTWHGYKSEEPHSSLARVRIDLPPGLDSAFQLTVQKTGCTPPPEFLQRLCEAKVGDTTFSSFLEAAQDAYRNAPNREREVAVPGRGLPGPIATAIRKMLLAGEEGCTPKRVAFAWRRLGTDRVFQIDLATNEVTINSRYKRKLLNGGKTSRQAAPFTVLLFAAIQNLLLYERAAKKVQEREQEINAMLIRTLDNKR